MDSYNSTACGDGLFGPSVWAEGCRGGFDFTCESTKDYHGILANYSSVSFQESILNIVPSALFLVIAGPRAFYLLKSPDKTKRHATYTPKLVRTIVMSLFIPTNRY
jgi:hypothetical protein